MSLFGFIVNSVLACFFTAQAIAAPASLPAYGADSKQTSVSGLSSGAFMAVQLQVAYSGSTSAPAPLPEGRITARQTTCGLQAFAWARFRFSRPIPG